MTKELYLKASKLWFQMGKLQHLIDILEGGDYEIEISANQYNKDSVIDPFKKGTAIVLLPHFKKELAKLEKQFKEL